MSETGQMPSAEDAFGPKPAAKPDLVSAAKPAAQPVESKYPSAEEAFGPKGSEPEKPATFWGGAADLGAATFADLARKPVKDGSSTPALDHYFDRTPAGRVLKAFGQQAAAPFHALNELTNTDNGEGLSFLKKAGVAKDWEKNHAASASYFRNSAMRPAAQQAVGSSALSMFANDLATVPVRAGANIIHAATELPGVIGYGAGVAGAFETLRRDLIDEPDDLSQLKGRAFEAKILPYLHKFVGQGGMAGKTAVELFDLTNVAFALTGVPQTIGKTAEEMSTALVKGLPKVLGPIPGRTEAQDQKDIQELTDKLNFYAMVVGPKEGGLRDTVKYQRNITRRLNEAQKAGVLGKPMTFDDSAAGLGMAAKQDAAQLKAANAAEQPPRPEGVPSPDIEPSATPEAAVIEAAPVKDVHTVARETAPEIFTEYDPVLARHRWYTGWINELRHQRDNDPRLAAAQEEIDSIRAKVGGVDERLTNRARQRIADIEDGMEAFRTTDTPDMVRIKQEMLKNYERLTEMGPRVQQAYRRSAEQVSREAEERGAEAPVETLHPGPVTEEPIGPQTVQPAVARPELPIETGHIWTPDDIARDVSRQLQAAGRPVDEAEAQGALIASHYEARAQRFGGGRGTAAELYRAEAPVIQGMGGRRTAGQRTFAQAASALSDAMADRFYSTLTRGVEGVRQEKAPADQWIGIIDNLSGVKKEEIEWSEVKNWLAEQTGPVTKADLLEYLHENEVQIQEVEKGIALRTVANAEETEHAGEPMVDVVDVAGRVYYTGAPTDAAEYIKEGPGGSKTTKFDSHTLPGGENYRELLLTLPENAGGERGPRGWGDTSGGTLDTANFRGGHFDEPNVLAHIRFDDRTGPNGEKILHVAEIQSDWHQKGRRQGYRGEAPSPVTVTGFVPGEHEYAVTFSDGSKSRVGNGAIGPNATMGDIERYYSDMVRTKTRELVAAYEHDVSDAPFKTTWQELATKRMLRYAVENDYDKLTWDTGATQADRYDLSKQVDDILYRKEKDGRYYIGARKDGKKTFEDTVAAEKLPNVVGKEVADKIVNGGGEEFSVGGAPGRKLSGLDLKVGGEGMKGFYDKILPDFVNKYVKKWGAKVENAELPSNEKSGFITRHYEGPAKTPAEVETEAKRFLGHHTWDNIGKQLQAYADALREGSDRPEQYLSDMAASTLGGKIVEHEDILPGHPAHSVTITDAMRDSVMQGQPLFQPNRGSITFKAGVVPIIRLMKDADASTFLHETGHHWLEELMTDAKHEQAPEGLRTDAAIVRNWLGAKDGETLTRQQHEKWARGFERYLMEGIAPNKQLAGVFAKFKQWLTKIYQSVAKLRSPISPEIRGVMDRLAATPETPTVIANPRNTAHMMADVHEVEATTALPEHAAAAADHIDSEIETQLRRVAPEEHDALLKSEGARGPVASPRPRPGSRPAQARSLPEPEGSDQTPSPFPARSDEAAPEGADVGGTAGEGGGAAARERGRGTGQADNGPVGDVGPGAGGEPGTGGGLEFLEGAGPPVASEFARNMEARAIAAGMPEDFIGELPTHGQLSFADQALKAVDLLHKDPDMALAIAMVEAEPPAGVMRPFIVKAVENKARREGDWETIRQLATNEKLANERTTIGRQLAAMGEFDPTDPVAAIRVVAKSREGKQPKGAVPAEVKGMREEIKKAASKKDAWAKMVDEIKCK